MRKKRKRKSAIESFPFRPVRRRLLFFSIKMCYSSVLASRRLPQSTSSSPSSSLSSVTSRSRELPRRPPPLSLTYVPSNSNNTRHQNLRFLKFKEIILVSPDVVVVVVTEINRQPLPLCVSLFFLVLLAPSLLARLASSLPKGRSPPKGKQAISSPLPPPLFVWISFFFLQLPPPEFSFFWIGLSLTDRRFEEFDTTSLTSLEVFCPFLERASPYPSSWNTPLPPLGPEHAPFDPPPPLPHPPFPAVGCCRCFVVCIFLCCMESRSILNVPAQQSSPLVARAQCVYVRVRVCVDDSPDFRRRLEETGEEFFRCPPPLWEPLPTITKQNVLLVGRAVQSVCRLSLSVWSWMMWSCFVQVLPRS